MSLLDYAICVTYVWIVLTNGAWPWWANRPYATPLGFGGLFVMGVLLVYKFFMHGGGQ